jgi:hypothetical protein
VVAIRKINVASFLMNNFEPSFIQCFKQFEIR